MENIGWGEQGFKRVFFGISMRSRQRDYYDCDFVQVFTDEGVAYYGFARGSRYRIPGKIERIRIKGDAHVNLDGPRIIEIWPWMIAPKHKLIVKSSEPILEIEIVKAD